jgi:hypothetical protein
VRIRQPFSLTRAKYFFHETLAQLSGLKLKMRFCGATLSVLKPLSHKARSRKFEGAVKVARNEQKIGLEKPWI